MEDVIYDEVKYDSVCLELIFVSIWCDKDFDWLLFFMIIFLIWRSFLILDIW